MATKMKVEQGSPLPLNQIVPGDCVEVMNSLPASVERRMPDGAFERVAVRRLGPGDVVRVLRGEETAKIYE